MELSNKVALVTGGAGGIGAVECRFLASRGVRVLIADRAESAGEDLVRDIRATNAECTFIKMDVTNPNDVESAFALADRLYGGVDILIANAGIGGPIAALADISLEDWTETVAINLTGSFLCCKAAVPRMQLKGWGRIVIIGSTTGKRPLPLRTPYAASKLALVGLARSLAHEVGRDGITVNVISPYDVEGSRIEGLLERVAASTGVDKGAVRDAEIARTATGRLVHAEDIARTIGFLCSDDAEAITGQDINVSCGAVMF